MKALEIFVHQLTDVVVLNGHISGTDADRMLLTFDNVPCANDTMEENIVFALTTLDNALADGLYPQVRECARDILGMVKAHYLI